MLLINIYFSVVMLNQAHTILPENNHKLIVHNWWYTFFYMWCYLVNEIVIIAVNLDQSPLLLDIHYALCYNNSVIIILGQACLVLRFFIDIYIRIQYIAIIKTVRTISTAIHLCILTLSYCFLSII